MIESQTRRDLLRKTATGAAAVALAGLSGGVAGGAAQEINSGRAHRALLVPRYGADSQADWYRAASSQLAELGILTKLVPLRPQPRAPNIDETLVAIAEAVGNDTREIGQTILIGHSVGSRALLAYLSRQGAGQRFAGLVSVAGWFTVDDLASYPALKPWVDMDLDFQSIAAAAGPITVHLSDNDPFTRDWRATAVAWLSKLDAAVHISHGAGHYMSDSPGPVLDTIYAALARTINQPHEEGMSNDR
jgi:predicted alpha/beta hydrolase family esterase